MKKLFYLLSFIFISSILIFSCKFSSSSGNSDSSDETTTNNLPTSVGTNILNGKTIYSEDLATKIVFGENTFVVSEYSADEESGEEDTSLSSNVIARALSESGTIVTPDIGDDTNISGWTLLFGTYDYTYNANTKIISYKLKTLTDESVLMTSDNESLTTAYNNSLYSTSQASINIDETTKGLTLTPYFNGDIANYNFITEITENDDLFFSSNTTLENISYIIILKWTDSSNFTADVYILDESSKNPEAETTKISTTGTASGTYSATETTVTLNFTSLPESFSLETSKDYSFTLDSTESTWTIQE